MAIPVYSTRFTIDHDSTSNGPFVVPDGETWVIRQVNVYNGNTFTVSVAFALYDTVNVATYLRHDWLINDPGFWSWEGRIVLPATSSFAYICVASGGMGGSDVYIGGYVLNAG